VPALLDHPVDHPDDPTGPVWIRLDRRPVQREQARSVWSRPDRRRASGYGSGGWSSNPRGEQHRVQGCSSSLAGARLTPGTGRQPRLRGQRRQRRGGGGSDVTDERRPRPNPPPDQRPDSNEEFRRALDRETDLSLREDPERRRIYTSMDLPHSRSPSDDRSLAPRRHHRYDELTWNGQTLTLIGWSQRTGIQVEVLLRRCRRGWSVEQVLTTPLGEDRSGPQPTS
jgi:hypothetical protein